MNGSLKKQRDSQLEEPYRSWINREYSLPVDVIVLPRKINVQGEAMLLIAVILGCLAMTALFLPQALGSIGKDVSADSLLVVVLIGIAIVILPFWVMRRFFLTLGAHRDQQCGKLRQGIIVGPVGILVRLSPNKCVVIPLESFSKAMTWSGGGDSSEEFIRIETKGGSIDFSERSLAVDVDAVNQSVFEVREARTSVAKSDRIGR